MYELPLQIQKAVRTYKPIAFDGLTLNPILVEDYEAFLLASPAIDAMQRSFPIEYVSMPLLAAYYQMDYDAMTKGEQPVGLFYRALLFLALSLRLGTDREAIRRGEVFQIHVDPKNMATLRAISADGIPPITPVLFQRMRPVLAAQNGIRLTSDDANPDLVLAERSLAAQNAPALSLRLEDLVASVAVMTNSEESDIYGWPIGKLYARSRAAQRILDYMICGIGAAQGTTWKGGNPAPSPFYDKEKTESSALISAANLPSGAAQNL